ncbi:MAG: chemotaxis protein CheW [Magnetococcales bacterium]|nr:chemotaxis protein CheW [Magnetococcales bacterium]
MKPDAASSSEITQYLTFTLSQEIFAVEIFRVKEVLEYKPLTKIPNTPMFMRGIINLRGKVVPVIDMRTKLGMEEVERTVNTCIIIVEVESRGEMAVFGAIVDSVREVMELGPSQIEPAPKIGTNLNTDFIRGMGKQGDQFIILLNTDTLFSADEMGQLSGMDGMMAA